MCFSISMAKTAQEIAEAFGVFSGDVPPLPEYYHVSGFSFPDVPVLYNSEGRKKIKLMKWGLVPAWIKSEKEASDIRVKTLNARSETADKLPSFRGSFRKGRCIIITGGFFEPHHKDGRTYPYFIKRKNSGILALGGLYASSDFNGNAVMSFSIITVPASPSMAEIHNKKKRMPFVIPSDSSFIDSWLDPELPPGEVKDMFRDGRVSGFRADDDVFEAYTVSNNIYKKDCKDSPYMLKKTVYPELTEGLFPF